MHSTAFYSPHIDHIVDLHVKSLSPVKGATLMRTENCTILLHKSLGVDLILCTHTSKKKVIVFCLRSQPI